MAGDPARRAALAGVTALAACVLIAFAASEFDAGNPQQLLGEGLLGAVVVSTLIVAVPWSLVVVALALRPSPSAYDEATTRSRSAMMIAAVVGALFYAGVLAVMVALAGTDDRRSAPVDRAEQPVGSPPPATPGSDGADVDWRVAGVLVAVGTLGSSLVVARLLRRERTSPEPEKVPAVLALAAERGVAAMEAEPDHRRAVILAYQLMEDSLRAAGAPRKPADAPSEYLERIMTTAGVASAPAGTLTRLFVHAKFSTDAIGLPERRAAAQALGEIRSSTTARMTAG